MTSVVPTTVSLGNVMIPVEWISSGAITPVGGSPILVSPAVVSEPPTTSAFLDALTAAQMTPPATIDATTDTTAAVTTSDEPVPSAPVTTLAMSASTSDPTLISSVAAATTGYASATGTAIKKAVGAGLSTARRVGSELWAGVRNPRAVHVSQVPSKFNPTPAAGNRDCGPASVVMTLGLLGKRIPGASAKASAQARINRVRQLAGNTANGQSTTNLQLEQALAAAGTTTREISDLASIKASVRSGKPVILNGNPRNPGAYGPTFSAAKMTPYDGAHWIVVSGFDTKTGQFIINDPLSKVGPVKVTAAQLDAYRGGSIGIEVAS